MLRRRLTLSAVPLALAAVVLAGCATTTSAATTSPASETSVIDAVAVDTDLSAAAVLAANEDATVTRDDEWSDAGAVEIDLSAETGSVVIAEAGVYRLSGSLDGSVVVTAPDDALVVLILDGVDISNDAGATIEVQTADDVAIFLAAGSENTVADASSYADDSAANAAVYSDVDLTISGSGSLVVTGNGNDGITSTDDLVVLSGNLTVDAADDALRGKDSLVIEGGTLDLTAGGDALTSDQTDDATRGYVWIAGGELTATSGDDGIDAATDAVMTGGTVSLTTTGTTDGSAKGIAAGVVAVVDDGDLTIAATDDGIHSDGSVGIGGGTIAISSGDDGVHADQTLEVRAGELVVSESVEGLEAADVAISGGVVDVTASDDGINAASGTTTTQQGQPGGGEQDTGETLVISGGTVRVAGGGDGLDSNGSITITGGDVSVSGPTGGGEGAIDANGSITIDGGDVTVAGSVLSTVGGAQAWIAASVSADAGDVVEISDSTGAVVASYTADRSFAAMFHSSAAVADGETYSVSIGGTDAATVVAGTALATQMGGGGPQGGGGPRP